jgi:rRNA-processing protein FCF1
VWDDSKWDETKWPSDDGLYEALLRRIRVLDKKNKPLNQSRDARIAETAIRAGLTLVTDDPRLSKATLEHGGKVLTLAQFSTLPGPHG